MNEKPRFEEALDQAAVWIGRLRSDSVTPEDKAAFSIWFAHSELNRRAFDRMLGMWQDLAVVQAMDFGLRPRPVQPRITRWLQVLRGNSLAMAGAAAAAAGIAVLALTLLLQGPTFETGVGEQATHTLADGSIVNLNTATRLDVDFDQGTRNLALETGEAFFEVTRDPLRPFVVHACNSAVVAVGTAFNVHCEGGNLNVTVTEGQVKVNSAAGMKLLTRAEQLTLADTGGAATVRNVDPANAIAWREQLHVYEGVPLRDVVQDLNRYSDEKIRVFDKSLGDIQVVARYRMTDRATTLASLEKTFPLRVVRLAGGAVALVPRD